ncbi:MAG TPA: helix-turn-helix domain-containing protein [Candidatus Nanopelagicales bacterium]|nr:helix-turn-helix domain-containing protein [Candidatus Nanopelagicales bacterium]
MPEQPLTAGAALAQARQAAGMTVAQVSAATRLRQTVVRALEDDDVELSGGPAYARAHIRSIAQALRIDPAPLLALLSTPSVAQTAPHPEPAADPAPARPEPRSLGGLLAGSAAAAEGPGRRGPNWSAVMAGALTLVLVAAVVQMVRGGGGEPATPTASPPAVAGPAPSGPQSSPSPSDPATTTPPPDDGGGDVVASADDVQVVLSVTGSASWVSATTKDGTLFEGTLQTGEKKRFKDRKKIRFVIGNAGAVQLKVNGVDVGSPGGDGQVVRTTFGPGDPRNAQA